MAIIFFYPSDCC